VAAKYRYPIKRSPARDPQQYRVYRMENEAIGARMYQRLTRTAMRRLVRSVCRNYRVPRIQLIWTDLGKWAAEWSGGEESRVVRLNTKKGTSQDMLTITHELAHHIHFWLSDGISEDQEDHGPEFMACHMSILDTCRVIPVVGMRAICDAWKVRYADPGTGSSITKLKRIVRRLPSRAPKPPARGAGAK
jgi:hypothetical protein